MPRAGGGGGGGHSSGGHSLGSRSSGGHHMSSPRAGGGSYRSSPSSRAGSGSGGMGGGRYRSSPPPRTGSPGRSPGGPRIYVGGPRDPVGGPGGAFRSPRRPRRQGCLTSILTSIVLILVIFVLVGSLARLSGSSSVPTSTSSREALDTGYGFNRVCIVDELGWFDDTDRTEKKLEGFYKETGVQPYIVLLDYNPVLTTDAEKEAYAMQYVEENYWIDPYGNTFCYFYFAEEDTDNDVGYMCYVAGSQVGTVMDSEAIDIFWAYMDQYWYSDLSTDDLFVTVFNKTADRIMEKSTTGADVAKYFVICVAVLGVGAVIIVLVNKKFKRDREKAAEDQKILNTSVDDLVKDNIDDKYL